MKNTVILILCMVIMNSISYGQKTYNYSEPREFSDGWKTNSLQSLDIDSTMIYKAFSKLQNENHKIHSVLVVKNNRIVIEEYFSKNPVNVQHDLRSATKSIISILMGIAIDLGYIESVNDPMSKYLKHPVPDKNIDERKDKITIEHLLTMSTGLDCNDWDKKSKGQEDKVYKKKDWLQYTLNLPVINEPGKVSAYCSMGVVLAAEIIARASGMPIDKFAGQYLFRPLEISNISWGHTSDKEVIPSAKRLYMTSRDMAKIGQLILNNGMWNKKQIVSEKWIKESTSKKTKITAVDYGFLWWNIPFNVNGNKITAPVATGNGGQYIMIFRELNIVAVFTGGAYNSQDDKLPFALMNNVFLPAFTIRK